MQVLFVSSEVSPYASSGGLGDVAGALPGALQTLGVDVTRIMPLYRRVADGPLTIKDTGIRIKVPMGHLTREAELWRTDGEAVTTWFVRRDEYFDRRELYSLPERDYDDNFERFVFFQKAVVQFLDQAPVAFDAVHANDWQTGLIPYYLEYGVDGAGRGRKEGVVYTVHNLAYQGVYSADHLHLSNLPPALFGPATFEFYGQINCLKAGLTGSDVITTVSPTYAKEICTEGGGFGLQGVLKELGPRLKGVLNGVDYSVWDPVADPHIAKNYHAGNLSGKRACKGALLKDMGLPNRPGVPLLGMVSRLADQKGMDILAEAMPALMERDVQLVLLGSGQEEYHQLCRKWRELWPEKLAVTLGFNTPMAHKIEAGSDIFLMPSKFEPCGLNQMYSLRYGTIPVVHSTGGLADTIKDMDEVNGGTGYKFLPYSADQLLHAVDRALSLFTDRPAWLRLVRRAMAEDFSWHRAAATYKAIYQDVSAV